jgi:hypothetical protein
MLRSDTVFVIGAGASNEVGLPVGSELASIIRQRMLTDTELLAEVQSRGSAPSTGCAYQQAAKRIADGIILSNSIDDFLDQNNDDPHIKLYGKAAIVKSIIESERKSSMFDSAGTAVNFQRVSASWYVSFFKMLTRGVSRRNLDSVFPALKFISFNYDRCLEHFLYNAVQQSYGIDGQAGAHICNSAKIYHPYGIVGALPYQNKNSNVSFGSENIANRCVELAAGIRTYTEEAADNGEINAIKDAVSKSERLVFLGFGFHQQNLEILARPIGTQPSQTSRVFKHIYATGFGISPYNRGKYEIDLMMKFNGPYDRNAREVIVSSCNCVALLNEFSAGIFS